MISILLSCYKSNVDFLTKQIDSIICQSEKDWELLIYNDGCGNWLEDLVNQLGCDKIKYFDEGHKGYCGAFNFLLDKARGEYICFCDHDDIWAPVKLEIQKQYLDEHPDTDCVFGWLYWFGEKTLPETFTISDEDISKELNFWQPIKNPTVMFRKERFGKFDSPFEHAADFWFWAKHKDRHYHLIERFLVNYRRHANEMTKDKMGFRENSAKVIQENLSGCLGVKPSLDICKMLDRYSKTYNPELKKFISDIIDKKREL